MDYNEVNLSQSPDTLLMIAPPLQSTTPPVSLINLEHARTRFGDARVDLLIELAYQGDPLADAVIQEAQSLGSEASRQMSIGIEQGLAALPTPPPALRAFLEAAEARPAWVDPACLQRGSDAYLSIGNVWIMLSLGPGSLAHTYSAPTIAKVLMQTQNLTKMATRRLIETGTWNIQTVLPGGLKRGAQGYVHNLQVRLLHARVRTALLKRGWDAAATGVPINQIEMVRTWLDFTYVPLNALLQLGISFTAAELADLYHFWRYVAYLLGVDDRLLHDLRDQAGARALLELIDSTMEPPNEDSKTLTAAMMASLTEFLAGVMNTPYAFRFNFVNALVRHFHGDRLADQLGAKRTWVSGLLPLFILQNRITRFRQRRNPALRRAAIEQTATILSGQAALLEGGTTYQDSVANPTTASLPQTKEGI